MTTALAIIFILLIFIVILIAMSITQIKMAGIRIKDFVSFINANENLDSLYRFAKRYDKMSSQEQIIYLAEAEKMFDAFEKIPETVWEDEYDKYSKVLNTYKDIKVMRWNEAQTYALSKKRKNIRPKEIKINMT
jgi:biopolymer transport protein ExbB/TolQ